MTIVIIITNITPTTIITHNLLIGSQLATVIQANAKYYAYPFNTNAWYRYAVVWEKVEHPDYDMPLLGFDGKWTGDPYTNDVSYYFKNCLISTNGNEFSYYRLPRIEQSLYKSERVCIPIKDVFEKEFFKQELKYNMSSLCPNNQTAIFDSHSYVKHFDTNPTTYGDRTIKLADFTPVNVIKYYKKDWDKKTKTYTECQALQSIYLGTIIIFSFESFLIFLQIISGTVSLIKKKQVEDSGERTRRIQHTIEFPLIGCLLMHILLTREEIKEYLLIDKRNSNENNVVVRLTGAYRPDNFMYTKVKVNSIICLSCFRNSKNCPRTVTLAQAIIYPLILPYTKSFWIFSDRTPCILKIASFVVLGPIVWSFSTGWFFANIVLFFSLVLMYGDELYIGRLLSDIPNFSMSISYILNVEYSNSAALSAAISSFLTLYYLGSMLLKSIKECRTRDEAKIQSTFHEVYGKMSSSQAICLIMFQPLIFFICIWFYIPMVLFGCSCFVDRGYDKIVPVAEQVDVKHLQVQRDIEISPKTQNDQQMQQMKPQAIMMAPQQPGMMMVSPQTGMYMMSPHQPGMIMMSPHQPGMMMMAPQQPGMIMMSPQQPGMMMVSPQQEQ